MRVGSLFSGIGGMDYGLAAAGHVHVFFAEIDPYRRDVLAARWPGVPIYHDVRDVEPARPGRRSAPGAGHAREPESGGGRLEPQLPELLCGGFPCQDLSVAGRRAGLQNGARSSLFFEYARVAESLRPRWLLIENVPGLLSSHSGRDFGLLLGTLADIGYGVAWRTLDSRFFGVPQRRRRVFIVGARADGDPRAAAKRAGEVLAVGTRCPRHPPTGTEARPDAPVASLSGLGTGGPDDNDGQAGRVIPVANTMKSQRGNGGGGVGPEETLVAVGLAQNQRGELLETSISHQLTAGGGKPGQGYPAARIDQAVRRLTPTECERLQALPDGWTQLGATPDSKRYSALGDAVTATVAEWIGRRLIAVMEDEW